MEKIELRKLGHSGIFDAFRFVAEARAKKLTRFAIQNILIAPDYIAATDGHRLHYCYIKHPFDEGLYEVIKAIETILIMVKVTSEYKFPKWQDIVPHHQQYFEVGSACYPGHFTETILAVLGKRNIMLDKDYLKPFSAIDRRWKVFFNGPGRPVRFISYEYKQLLEAVIMPINGQLDQIKVLTKSERRKKAG